MDEKKEVISISLPSYMVEWLNNNNINRSQFFQKTIEDLMKKQRFKIHPLYLLTSTIGIVLSVSVFTFSIGLMQYLGVTLSSILFLTGVILLAVTILTLINVRKHGIL